MTIKEQIQKLLEALNEGIFEKETEIKMALLTAIAGESIFLLGAPGVAKSLIARRLKYAFKDAKAFEYLMSRFSTPDEIFGPVSISKLKDEDKYERLVSNYLPDATVVFLDEIWKAGPSIQNALLTVLNEKIYRNGDKEIKIPLKALISASNELPATGEGLEALWDRFLVRLVVKGVENQQNFNDMISKPLDLFKDNVPLEIKLTEQKYKEIQSQIDKVKVPKNVFGVIHAIRQYIHDYNQKNENQIYISDRRWRKILRLLRTSAFLNDRTYVDLMDCFLITYCLWDNDKQQDEAVKFVKEAIQKYGYKLTVSLADVNKELTDLKADVETETKFVKNVPLEILKYYKSYNAYKVIGFNSNYEYITEADFNNLTSSETHMYIYYLSGKSLSRDYSTYRVKKGKDAFHVVINGNEYKMETETKEEERVETRKPNKVLEAHWDKSINLLLTTTEKLKEQLENYRQIDLQHLRNNLFVDASKATIVENHISDKRIEIEKLELEIKSTQNKYKSLKDKVVVSKK